MFNTPVKRGLAKLSPRKLSNDQIFEETDEDSPKKNKKYNLF